MTENVLQPTSWLAKRLGLSVSTVERLRVRNPASLPPHIHIGSSIRYDEVAVNVWLQTRLATQATRGDHGA